MQKGIDVSAHNGVINWQSVKAAGVTFAMLRMGYSTTTDKRFVEYYKGAKAAGIKVGGYWFAYAIDTAGATYEANACIKLLKQYPLDLPVFYDFEDDTERYAKTRGISYTPALRTAIIKMFCERLKMSGCQVGVYANENYIVNMLTWESLKSYPLWLAKWPGYGTGRATGYTIDADSVTKKWGAPVMWQFTDSGKINGISNHVDLDYCYLADKQQTVKPLTKYIDGKGFTYRLCKDVKIVYHDAVKTNAKYGAYASGGFFQPFPAENSNEVYTLPVANLVCDIPSVPDVAKRDLQQYIRSGKLRWSNADNHSNQFRGREVSTLVIPTSGKPYVAELSAPPARCLYAISGVPVVRKSARVDYASFVVKQGWDTSCLRAAYRNWIGIREGELWLIYGPTTSANYIKEGEFWNKVQEQGFTDIIALDGGGSFIFKDGGSTVRTSEPRRINNLVVFT